MVLAMGLRFNVVLGGLIFSHCTFADFCRDRLSGIARDMMKMPNASWVQGRCVENVNTYLKRVEETESLDRYSVLFITHEEMRHSGLPFFSKVDIVPNFIAPFGHPNLGHHAVVLKENWVLDMDYSPNPIGLSEYLNALFPPYRSNMLSMRGEDRLSHVKARVIPARAFQAMLQATG